MTAGLLLRGWELLLQVGELLLREWELLLRVGELLLRVGELLLRVAGTATAGRGSGRFSRVRSPSLLFPESVPHHPTELGFPQVPFPRPQVPFPLPQSQFPDPVSYTHLTLPTSDLV